MTHDDLKFTEICQQEYGGNNCKFSSGFVEGHPVDTMYFKAEKDGVGPTLLLLRPDEVAAIVWVLSGLLWSHHESILREGEPEPAVNSLAEN